MELIILNSIMFILINYEKIFWLLLLILSTGIFYNVIAILSHKHKYEHTLEEQKVIDYMNSDIWKYGNYFDDVYNPY